MSSHEGIINAESRSCQDSWTNQVMFEFASVLDDFLDEEVVDNQGMAIGTLACYWPSARGPQVFLGVKVNGQESLRVVPGRRSQVDDRQSCIRLAFDAEDIEAAPCFDSARELDTTLERTVYEHFGVAVIPPRKEAEHPAHSSEAVSAAANSAASIVCVATAPGVQLVAPVQEILDKMNPAL